MDRVLIGRLTVRGALRVPEITAYFWAIKALSTAMGESTSDYLVHAMDPKVAVVLGFIGFVAALALQFWMRRYNAWTYWLAVVGVGVFGTMAADVLGMSRQSGPRETRHSASYRRRVCHSSRQGRPNTHSAPGGCRMTSFSVS